MRNRDEYYFDKLLSYFNEFSINKKLLVFWARTLHKFVESVKAEDNIVKVRLTHIQFICLKKFNDDWNHIVIISAVGLLSDVILQVNVMPFSK